MTVLNMVLYVCSKAELLAHVRCPEHEELMTVLNRSVPAIIRRIRLVGCPDCPLQFRLNFSLRDQRKI
jgi:hypothetical protein